MQVKVKLNTKGINLVKEKMIETLVETADATKSDLAQSQTMPFDTGALQNRSTFVNDRYVNQGKVSIVTDTPYARYQYFGKNRFTEYKTDLVHKTDKNSKAGPFWFDPYINGNKKEFIQNTFNRIARSKMK